MSKPKTGTVTFLFTDIEGSTRLAHRLQERWSEVLVEHRNLIREPALSGGGHEIDCRGDELFVAFEDASAAARTAIDAQLAFAEQEWPSEERVRVRIGMHTGEAIFADSDYLGVEVHTPGVGALLKQIGERGLTNVRIIQHDAVDVLTHMLAPASLSGIHVFFPDPWHKKRHHKRRLIQPSLVSLLASRLAPTRTVVTIDPLGCLCSTMFRVSPNHLLWVLEGLVDGEVNNRIVVPEPTKTWALVALDRMLDLSRKD